VGRKTLTQSNQSTSNKRYRPDRGETICSPPVAISILSGEYRRLQQMKGNL